MHCNNAWIPTDRGEFKSTKNVGLDARIRCMECGKRVQSPGGLVCANFGDSRGSSRDCRNAWHGSCYRQHPHDRFPVLQAGDLDDALMDENDYGDPVDDPTRFHEMRSDDIFMCPFQCDTCQCFNIPSRYPTESHADELLILMCIRLATLDELARSTVKKKLGEVRGIAQSSRLMGIRDPFPPGGPAPKQDSPGS